MTTPTQKTDEVIFTLKDIQDILSKIPIEILDTCYFGMGEGSEDKISLVCEEEDYMDCFIKYPQLSQFSKLIENVSLAQSILDEQEARADKLIESLYENGEAITSNFFDKGRNGK